ncbi:hypothetical protein LTR37_013254 [Vermiconidia calcicola]|uniref:Uncharacterized protein n=1 Tax=Vermiconidia calcicola TaxID=1690605 RepID=A0ACC3MX34_9PEZI|nr:hypothetical protein LTR37_013254 [Vermiconidia calcicola]
MADLTPSPNAGTETTRLEQDRAARELSNQNCHLVELAPELRNRIYGEVIPRDKEFTSAKRHDRQASGLMQACRSIRFETTPIFYHNSTFVFNMIYRYEYVSCISWLQALSSDALATMRKVNIKAHILCYTHHRWGPWRCWIDRGSLDRPVHVEVGVEEHHCISALAEAQRAQRLLEDLHLGSEEHPIRLKGLDEVLKPLAFGQLTSGSG